VKDTLLRRGALSAACSLSIASHCPLRTVFAEQDPTVQSLTDADTGGGLQEITVPARRVAENIQRVPIAITAFTQAELTQSNIRGSLTNYLPEPAPAVIPGVVFAGSWDGHERAYSAADGTILWNFDAGVGIRCGQCQGTVLVTSGHATATPATNCSPSLSMENGMAPK
jgi:outer membrane receptor protein involved in Fe transport